MDLFDAIRDRRSIRSFKPDPVPDELLEKVLDAGRWAPSAGNLQPWEFIVVKDKEVKKQLTRAALGQSFVFEAPVDIVVCANRERSARYYGSRGWEFYSLCDTSAAIQNMLLAAHGLGLGACWIGAFRDEEVSRVMNLPEHVRPVAIIPIGYPDRPPPRPPSRLPLDRLVHKDRYGEKNKG